MKAVGAAATMLSVVFLVDSAIIAGQSLAEIARREEARRARLAAAGKVYTDADLPADVAASVPASPAAANATPAEPVTKTAADDDEQVVSAEAAPRPRDKRPEAHWREAAARIRDRRQQLRADIDALESRIAALESGRGALTDAAAEAQQAADALTGFKTELRYIDQEWAALERRARQAEIPLRWLQ